MDGVGAGLPGPPRTLARCGHSVKTLGVLPGYPSCMNTDLLKRITRDPAVMGGRPCIRGMRVTVGTLVGLLAAGKTVEQILTAYPYVERDDVMAALAYAAWRAEEVDVPLRVP